MGKNGSKEGWTLFSTLAISSPIKKCEMESWSTQQVQ